ncbi:hypothetical protein ACWD4J_17190 [Streptomyces sp. NPDC002577]
MARILALAARGGRGVGTDPGTDLTARPNGGRVQSEDGLLQTTLAIPKELGGAGNATAV